MDRSQKLFVYLSAVFVSCLLLGDVIGGKFIATPLGPISVGIVPFSVTFLLTDIVNDFYGRRTFLRCSAIGWRCSLTSFSRSRPTSTPTHPRTSPRTSLRRSSAAARSRSSPRSSRILISQFLDIRVFQYWKALTQSRHLWLRANRSGRLAEGGETW